MAIWFMLHQGKMDSLPLIGALNSIILDGAMY